MNTDWPREVYRIGDMHHERVLCIEEQRGGDVIISILQRGSVVEGEPRRGEEVKAIVEFCVSGGRSPKVREALRLVADAMREENIERPIPLWEDKKGPS